jgi:hypothetical protein
MHTQTFIDNWAVYNLFVNLDSYLGSGHNYYLYHDSVSDKFYWLPWDVNEAFGSFNMNMSMTTLENLSVLWIASPSSNKPLQQKMIGDAAYKQQYLDRVCYFLNTTFDTAHLYQRIDSLSDWIRPSVYADTKKFFPNNQFEQNLTSDVGNLPGLKSFLAARIDWLTQEMATQGCEVTSSLQPKETTFNVYPNPATDRVVIENANGLVEIFDVTGRLVNSTHANGTTVIDVSNLEPGVYALRSNGQVIRLVKQ